MTYQPENVLYLVPSVLEEKDEEGYSEIRLKGCAAVYGTNEAAFYCEQITTENKNAFGDALEAALKNVKALIVICRNDISLISEYAGDSTEKLKGAFEGRMIGAGGLRGQRSPGSPAKKQEKKEEKLDIKSAVRMFAIIANKATPQEVSQNCDPQDIELEDLIAYYGIEHESTGSELTDRLAELKAVWETMQPFFYGK